MDATLAAPPSAAGLLPGWAGTPVADADGATVGVVADVLFDTRTHAPGWVVLRTPEREVLAPACGLRHRPGGVRLACSAATVAAAPAVVVPPGELGRDTATVLARHFGVRCGAGPWRGVAAPTARRD